MIFFLACMAIGFGIFAAGCLFGLYLGLKGQELEQQMMSSYENTYTDPVDVYIPVTIRPKVYDWQEEVDA